MSKKLIASAIAIATLAPLPAAAQAVERAVSFADLNLATTSGQHVLQQRIRSAIREACGEVDAIELRQMKDVRGCKAKARVSADRAIAQAIGAHATDRVLLAAGRR